jgi:hypothetical protein
MLLLAAMKSPDKKGNLKLKGKARMASMLKSGKALEIFSVKESDLGKFMQGAKQYGIVYCVLRNTKNSPDGMCDIMVKADDAPKISRLVERFKFATVDKAKIESEIVAAKTDKTTAGRSEDAKPEAGADHAAPDVDDTEKLVSELLGTPEGKTEPEAPETEKAEMPETTKAEPVKAAGKEAAPNPDRATTEEPHPSAPISENKSNSAAGGIMSKDSVRDELRDITARKKKEAETAKRNEPAAEKPKGSRTTTHKQPQNNKKSKSKKSKGNR